MKLYRITDSLYISGSFKRTTLEKKRAALKNIDTVVCLLRRYDEELARQDWVEYVVSPVPDATKVNVMAADQATAIVLNRLARGKRVLAHCVVGKNRSGLVAALVLIRRYGFSGNAAVAKVRQLRPGALYNPAMVKYLETNF